MHIPKWPQAGEREAKLLQKVLESTHWGGFHPFVTQFENQFAEYQHAAHGIALCNGTVSLELALSVLGVGPGDEVIVPAISFVSSASAVSRAGAVPVFVDIERRSFNIDPLQVRNAISPATKAIMPVHFGGTMCCLEELIRIAREHELILLEDAAHAQGSEWNGKRAGSFGNLGSFSFQNGKVLSAGEGGALVTLDEEFAVKARSVANCGRLAGRSFYEHHTLGSNFRMTAFQAAVLIGQLERLPEQIEHRTRNARLLMQLTADVQEIIWQEQPLEATRNSWYLLVGRIQAGAEQRDEFQANLSKAGVPCTPFYPWPLYRNPLFSDVECRVLPCPIAEACVRDAFWLPHRVLLADEETIREVAEVIRAAVPAKTTLGVA